MKQMKKTEKTGKMNSRVFPWWKRYGETIRETRERFLLFHPELRDVSIRYEGRLDPLAEGVILFVVPHKGEEALRHLEKVYEVDALLGFQTDSGDILGLIEEVSMIPFSVNDIRFAQQQSRELLAGCHQLPIPLYSSPHIKELREKRYREGAISKRKMCFSEIQSKTLPPIERDELLGEVERLVPSIPGDFRQEKILSRWRRIIPLLPEQIPSFRFSFRVSSGSYVRSFLAEFSRQTKIPATSLRIRRTMMGGWSEQDCPFL